MQQDILIALAERVQSGDELCKLLEYAAVHCHELTNANVLLEDVRAGLLEAGIVPNLHKPEDTRRLPSAQIAPALTGLVHALEIMPRVNATNILTAYLATPPTVLPN